MKQEWLETCARVDQELASIGESIVTVRQVDSRTQFMGFIDRMLKLGVTVTPVDGSTVKLTKSVES